MTENMQFPIPNDVIEPYIKAAVSTVIASALGDGTELINKAVQAALNTKVDRDGKVSRYSSDNKHSLAEVLALNAIRNVAKETINEMAEQMRPKIRKQIREQLLTKHSELARALVDGMIESLACRWSVSVKLDGKG